MNQSKCQRRIPAQKYKYRQTRELRGQTNLSTAVGLDIRIPSRLGFRCCQFLEGQLGHHFLDNLGSLVFPFVAVQHGIIEALITGNSEDIAVLEFLGQGNDIVIKKANLPEEK